MKIDKEKGLAFLRTHQQSSNSNKNKDDCDEWFEEWTEVCEYFINNPDIEAVPLFLGLGSIDSVEGFEFNQYFSNLVAKLDPDEVAPHLIEALSSSSLLTRTRAAEACADVLSSNPSYINTLLSIVEDFDENDDVRSFCASAFSLIGQEGCFDVEKYKKRVKAVLKKEEDEDIIMFLDDLLDEDDEDNGLTRESALSFLREHQPMPDSSKDRRRELFRQWDNIAYYFIKYPAIESIPLFIGSLGDLSGNGVYERFRYVVGAHDPELVAPYMISVLTTSTFLPVRILVAEACTKVLSKNPEFHDMLLSRVEDLQENHAVRSYCANAISNISINGLIDVPTYRKRVEAIIEQENRMHKIKVDCIVSDLKEFLGGKVFEKPNYTHIR